MKPATAFKPSHSCAVLLVGEPKSGKTRTMFSFPKPAIIDADMNLASGARVLPGDKTWWYFQPALNDDGTEVPLENRWMRCVDETKAMLKNPDVQTVVIDGLGVMCEWIMAHIVKVNKAAGTNKTGKMELRDYGDLARLLREYIMMLRLPGKYIVVTSHQSAEKDELTGALRYSLAIPGQSKETLGGLFTDVWATMASNIGGKVKYEIRTKPTGLHVALGTSFDFPSALDITDKTPAQIWDILAPKLSPLTGAEKQQTKIN